MATTKTSEEVTHAELVVIGAGPGGYTAAFRAADLGLGTVLVERYPVLGGVCLNVGCIPSKALLHVADVVDQARELSARGVRFGEPTFDLDALRVFKDGVVRKLTDGLSGLAVRRNVEVVQGSAVFSGPKELLVEDDGKERSITFEKAIIAVGSRVVKLPGLPWDDPRLMDSTDALELAGAPKTMLIIGGGIIGLEMATVYAGLGTKITVVELTDQLVPGADKDLVRPLRKRLEARGVEVLLGTKVTDVKAQKKGLKVAFEGAKAPKPKVFERVLVAVGRRPNGDLIRADAAGVEVSDRGFISVDKQQRTNVEHIFAIGDVTGQPMLAHKATHEAKVAAEVAAGLKHAFDARVVPAVAYTDPEVAWVGVTEAEAKAAGRKVGVGRFPWAASGRALGLGRDEGQTKLIFDSSTRRLIGGGIVGPHAGDLIAELALAIELGADAEDIALTIHPHPTLSETIAFSAEAFEGTITDLYVPPKR